VVDVGRAGDQVLLGRDGAARRNVRLVEEAEAEREAVKRFGGQPRVDRRWRR
jgi:hypothetical protein